MRMKKYFNHMLLVFTGTRSQPNWIPVRDFKCGCFQSLTSRHQMREYLWKIWDKKHWSLMVEQHLTNSLYIWFYFNSLSIWEYIDIDKSKLGVSAHQESISPPCLNARCIQTALSRSVNRANLEVKVLLCLSLTCWTSIETRAAVLNLSIIWAFEVNWNKLEHLLFSWLLLWMHRDHVSCFWRPNSNKCSNILNISISATCFRGRCGCWMLTT